MYINDVEIEDTFAEAFDMKALRLVLTAHDRRWLEESAAALTGFGTSVIACGIEIDVEQQLSTQETPDGRCGCSVLAFAVSGKELEKQIPRRVGQCVLTCPTTAVYAGSLPSQIESTKRVSLGKNLRFFGDGHQISKVVDETRYWRIPAMDGEFVCQHDVPRFEGVGGGNFLLCGEDIDSVTVACRAAKEKIAGCPGVITPFPGGATRSGSKVGSKYPGVFASTNESYCPTLRHHPASLLRNHENVVLEIVIDGVDSSSIRRAMAEGIIAAAGSSHGGGLHRITAGNYGGKLGRHHFRLKEILSDRVAQ